MFLDCEIIDHQYQWGMSCDLVPWDWSVVILWPELRNPKGQARRWEGRGEEQKEVRKDPTEERAQWVGDTVGGRNQTLHATLCGQFFPKPSGGEIVRTTLYISL